MTVIVILFPTIIEQFIEIDSVCIVYYIPTFAIVSGTGDEWGQRPNVQHNAKVWLL